MKLGPMAAFKWTLFNLYWCYKPYNWGLPKLAPSANRKQLHHATTVIGCLLNIKVCYDITTPSIKRSGSWSPPSWELSRGRQLSRTFSWTQLLKLLWSSKSGVDDDEYLIITVYNDHFSGVEDYFIFPHWCSKIKDCRVDAWSKCD